MASSPNLRSIAAAFGGVVSGDQALIPSPGHSSRDRGTSIRLDPDAPDGCLVNSFNGADPLAIKDEMRARGLLPERESRNGNGGWRRTGTYIFRNEIGDELYRTHRLERPGKPKRYEVEHADGNGGWAPKIGGARRVLYRLPELIAADPVEPVYFVEGERKADKLASWGLTATAIAFGANGWRRDYAASLAGRTVVILPDNDEPGREFAKTVKAAVDAAGGTAQILELPDLAPKGDIMDWPGTANELADLVAKALGGTVLPLRTLDLAELATIQPRAKSFAVEKIAPLGEVTLFTGKGSAGKSLLGQQLATCAAAGLRCLGLSVIRGPAIYLTCEDDDEQLHWRQTQICKSLGVPMASLAGALHLVSLRGALDNAFGTFGSDGTLSPAPAFHRLVAMIKATCAKIVILDNVAHLFTGNENDRGDVTQFVNLLNRAAGEMGPAMLLVGHPNKGGDDYSGSTAWLNAVRSQVFLDHDMETDLRTLTLGKANYAQKGDLVRFLWVDGAFVREDELPPDAARELRETVQASGDNELFLSCLRERTKQHRAVSEKRGPTYAPTEFAKMAESKGIGKDRLDKAMDRLFRISAIERAELWKGDDRKPVFGLREVRPTLCAANAGDPHASH